MVSRTSFLFGLGLATVLWSIAVASVAVAYAREDNPKEKTDDRLQTFTEYFGITSIILYVFDLIAFIAAFFLMSG